LIFQGKPVFSTCYAAIWGASGDISQRVLRSLALPTVTFFVTACLTLAAAGLAQPALARDGAAKTDVATVSLSALPREAQQTQALILAGGPFPYAKDGSTFGNRERLLPPKARGHYREYTVATPGSRDRGARRIVCGGPQKTAPEACYYTADHYNSFRQIQR
jgi:ribonuclease T1